MSDFDVVISGLSGKFPDSEDIQQLKENLLNGLNLVTEDKCRWNKDAWKHVPAATGNISVVEKFDDTFFGLASKIAGLLDPLTRVVIERIFEALIDAGINPKDIRGSNTGIYATSCLSDSEAMGCDDKMQTNYWLMAHVRALMSNRISYLLNLRGPSVNTDVSWIGGFQCLQQAAIDVHEGRIERALVAASNVILFPNLSQHWSKLGKLSSDGVTRPFDEDANGYGRSEGVVVFLIQRTCDAKRSYASIAHVDTTFCGKNSINFIKPSKEMFQEFLEKFYKQCKVSASDVTYIEADGSSDKYMDVIEMNAVGDVFCNEKRKKKLMVGSIKGNVGHTEGASALVSICKALIILDSGVIPPTINYKNPNSKIPKLVSKEIQMVTEPTDFPEGGYVAVNAVGLTCMVGHALLKQNPKRKPNYDVNSEIPRLILVSARTEKGIVDVIDKLESMPFDPEYCSLANDVFRDAIPGHFHRGYTIVGSTEKAIHYSIEAGEMEDRPIWYLFSGMGSQWTAMGSDLMSLPAFKNAIQELTGYLLPLGINLENIITSHDPTVLKDSINTFVGITAMQIGFVDVLTQLGIKPDGILGHSLGECACAYADGCFTKYQTIMAAYHRGNSSRVVKLKGKGLMASVGLGYKDLKDLPKDVEIACHNSMDNTTISGPADQIELYAEKLKKMNVFCRVVNSNEIAYHCKQLEPLVDYVYSNLKKVIPNPIARSSRWISTSIKEENWNTPLGKYSSAEYHINNFRNTVYFAEACKHIPENAIIIEISPHGLFQGILKKSLSDSCYNIAIGKRGSSSPLNYLLSVIGKFYVAGLKTNVNALYPQVEYPVSRGTLGLAQLVTWNHEENWIIKTYVEEEKIKSLEVSLHCKKWRYLNGHKINGQIILPISLPLTKPLEAFDENRGPYLIYEDVLIKALVPIDPNEQMTIFTQLQYGSGNFECRTENEAVITGRVSHSDDVKFVTDEYEAPSTNEDEVISFNDVEIYEILKYHSLEYINPFRKIHQITFTNQGVHASIIWSSCISTLIDTITQLIFVIDICLSLKKPTTPISFLKFVIDSESIFSIKNESKINVFVDKNTGVVRGPFFELIGFKTTTAPISKLEKITLHHETFIPFENPPSQNVERFLNLCLQIIIQHVNETKNDNLKIITTQKEEEGTKNMVHYISQYLQTNHKNKVEFVKMSNDLKPNKEFTYLLIIDNLQSMNDSLINKAQDMFVLTYKKCSMEPFSVITQKQFDSFDITLFKKKVPIGDETIITWTSNTNENSITNLKSKLKCTAVDKPVIVELESKYQSDIIEDIKRTNLRSNIRFIVKMNENNVKQFSYKNQLEKGLIVNIMKDNKWGSILEVPLDLSTRQTNKFVYLLQSLKDVEVEYVTEHEINDDPNYLEYYGKIKNKQGVMGVVYEGKSNVICRYQWNVPNNWSSENSIASPLAYFKVYYGLIVMADLQKGSKVFVFNGSSIIGETSIAFCASMGCEIFTSANSSQDELYIKQRFKSYKKLTILRSDRVDIGITCLQSITGCGFDSIINANTEKELLQASDCIDYYGTIIHFPQHHISLNREIGLRVFVKSISFYSVTNLEELCKDEKERNEIIDKISKDIQNGVIKPYSNYRNKQSTTFRISNEPISNGTASSKTRKINQFVCDPQKGYLVIGNKNGTWFRLVVFLLQNGCKKLIITDDGDNMEDDNQYMKQLYVVINNAFKDISITYISSMVNKNKQQMKSAIQDITKYVQLDGTFLINLDENTISNLDLCCQELPLRIFICLQCNNSNLVCERRKMKSLCALDLKWDDPSYDFTEILREIFLGSVHVESSSIRVINENTKDVQSSKINWMDYAYEFLPNYDHLRNYCTTLSECATFSKIPSKCAEYTTSSQLFPIFITPATDSFILKPLIEKLMYPVFSANYPKHLTSPKAIAQSLLKPLKEIQSEGPYTIFGEKWSSVIAIHLTCLLQEQGEEVKLILLNGIPSDMQNIFAEAYNLQSSHLYKEPKIGEARDILEEFISNRLQGLKEFSPNDVKIEGSVIVVENTDKIILTTHMQFEQDCGCEIAVSVIAENNYEKLISSEKLSNLINENVLFKW